MLRKAFAITITFSLCHVCTAYADLAIKKLIMRDCAKAKLEPVSIEDRAELVRFLSLLLKQRPASVPDIPFDTSVASKKISPFDSPLDEGTSGDLLRFFDPTRETEAKRCAIEFLSLFGKDSFPAIPAMIELSTDKNTPALVKEPLAETMLRITKEAVSDPSFIPDQKVIGLAVSALSQPYRAFAETFLIELGAKGIPPLITELRKPNAENRARIASLLPMIDSQGIFVGPKIEELLKSGEEGLRMKALAILPQLDGYLAKGIPQIIKALSDLSPSVQDEAIRALRAIPIESWKDYKGLSEVTYPIVTFIKSVAVERRQPASELLEELIPFLPNVEQYTSPLLDEDDDLKLRSLVFLGILGTISDSTFDKIVSLTTSSIQSVRVQAIETLTRFQNRRAKVLDTLLALLKKSTQSSSVLDRGEVMIAQAIAQIATSQDIKRTAPVLMPYLPQGIRTSDDPIINFFTRLGSSAGQYLLPILKEKDSGRMLTALHILKSTSAKDKNFIAQAVTLLKTAEPAVFKEIISALTESGDAAVPYLKKLLKGSPGHVRFAAARLLALRGQSDAIIQSTLFEGLISEDCSSKGEILALISKLQGGVSRQLTGPLLQCARMKALSPEAFVSLLVRLKPFSDETRLELLDLVRAQETDRALKLKLLEAWNVLGLPEADVGAILVSMLNTDDNTLRFASFSVLRSMGDKAKPILPKLVEFIDNDHHEPLLRHEAALTVIAIDPNVFDYVNFFVREFKEDRAEWAIRSLKRLKSEELSKVLQRAVENLSVSDRVPVVRLIGELPPDIATPFVPKVLPFLTSRITSLRYTAVITLLKISPNSPEIIPALRRELIDSQRQMLIAESFPPSVKPVLESMLPQATSRVEEMGIREILNSIQQP